MAEFLNTLGTTVDRLTGWVTANEPWLSIALVLILPIIGVFVGRLSRTVDLRFDPVHEDSGDFMDLQIPVRVQNFGAAVASIHRYRWTPACDCKLGPVPMPLHLAPGQSHTFGFEISHEELFTQQIPFPTASPLGELEVFYRGLLGRERRTGFTVSSDPEQFGYGPRGVILLSLSPVPLMQRWQFTQWLHTQITNPDLRRREHEEAVRQESARHLANARSILQRRGIRLSGTEADRSLLFEGLSRRRWHWEFEPSGTGTVSRITKTWPPSSSHTIVSHGDTVEDALTKSLAAAIQEEEARLRPSRLWPQLEGPPQSTLMPA